MKLIVGLGNPGRDYAHNRHNIGFMCIEHFARQHGISLDKKQALAKVGTGRVDDIEVVLAKPQTYVNLSGQSVCRLMEKHHVAPADLLVICDDLDLTPGRIRIRPNGSSGGHKGLKSIIAELGGHDFPRLRVGIGRPPVEVSEEDIIDYVLNDFTREEKPVITEAISRVSEAILCFLTEDLNVAMNKYNG